MKEREREEKKERERERGKGRERERERKRKREREEKEERGRNKLTSGVGLMQTNKIQNSANGFPTLLKKKFTYTSLQQERYLDDVRHYRTARHVWMPRLLHKPQYYP